jgi:hypothetical protein
LPGRRAVSPKAAKIAMKTYIASHR